MRMKSIRIFSCFFAVSLSILGSTTAFARLAEHNEPQIMAEAGIVMDIDSGTVIFGQNIHLPYAPASIAKLLTALVVLENTELDEMVTFSWGAVYDLPEGSGNKCSMEAGDMLSVEDCLYLLLLQSSNQAANALAEYVCGSREAFAELMNRRAAQLGCSESRFINPSGLDDEGQFVSAYDMALIAQAAYSNPELIKINSAREYTIPATANNPKGVSFTSEHKLMTTDDTSGELYCPGVIAGKPGYSLQAGNTLVTWAVRDGKNLVAVVLKGNMRQYYIDTRELLEFGFAHYCTSALPELG